MSLSPSKDDGARAEQWGLAQLGGRWPEHPVAGSHGTSAPLHAAAGSSMSSSALATKPGRGTLRRCSLQLHRGLLGALTWGCRGLGEPDDPPAQSSHPPIRPVVGAQDFKSSSCNGTGGSAGQCQRLRDRVVSPSCSVLLPTHSWCYQFHNFFFFLHLKSHDRNVGHIKSKESFPLVSVTMKSLNGTCPQVENCLL